MVGGGTIFARYGSEALPTMAALGIPADCGTGVVLVRRTGGFVGSETGRGSQQENTAQHSETGSDTIHEPITSRPRRGSGVGDFVDLLPFNFNGIVGVCDAASRIRP